MKDATLLNLFCRFHVVTIGIVDGAYRIHVVLKSSIMTLPEERFTTGTLHGSGMKLSIFWYEVWDCHVEAFIRATP